MKLGEAMQGHVADPPRLHKPSCHNHKPPAQWFVVQDGYRTSLAVIGENTIEVEDRAKPKMRQIVNQNSRGCAVINAGEAAYHGYDCSGCYWAGLPIDPTEQQIQDAIRVSQLERARLQR